MAVKNFYFRIFVLFIVFIININIIHAQTKEQDITKLLNMTNSKDQAAQMFDLMLPNLIEIAPNVPNTFWTTFRSKIDLDGFSKLLVPIYDKSFSHNDIKELLKFYESPIGKKLLEATPAITRESYIIGEQWGKQLGMEIVNELMKYGYF